MGEEITTLEKIIKKIPSDEEKMFFILWSVRRKKIENKELILEAIQYYEQHKESSYAGELAEAIGDYNRALIDYEDGGNFWCAIAMAKKINDKTKVEILSDTLAMSMMNCSPYSSSPLDGMDNLRLPEQEMYLNFAFGVGDFLDDDETMEEMEEAKKDLEVKKKKNIDEYYSIQIDAMIVDAKNNEKDGDIGYALLLYLEAEQFQEALRLIQKGKDKEKIQIYEDFVNNYK